MKIRLTTLLFFLTIEFAVKAQLTEPTEIWDSIKENATPIVAPEFAANFGSPYRMQVSAYGWEDGLQMSADGLNLYTLYAPADLLSWFTYINTNIALPICETLGNTEFIRPYAETFGMDMAFNFFGCDSGINLDILYAHRDNINDEFENWILSDIARPGTIEGGPFPVQSTTNANNVDHFLFTGSGDIWMINYTSVNPSDIESAMLLPEPINSSTGEFIADNPVMRRFNDSDTLLLVYEKYVIGAERDFMYTLSFDDGETWDEPIVMTSITAAAGHIEHPQLHENTEGSWLYYSRNYDIYRMKQSIPNNWDSWVDEELIISKGNALVIGEPSIAKNGDIAFLLGYENTGNLDDRFDLDPWYVRNLFPDNITSQHKNTNLTCVPNPATNYITINFDTNIEPTSLSIFSIEGQLCLLISNPNNYQKIDVNNLHPGLYVLEIINAFGAKGNTHFIIN